MHSDQVSRSPWLRWGVLVTSVLWVAGCGDSGEPGDRDGGGNQNNSQGSCGNGVREGAEECDDGALCSDTLPDGCRTNCLLAHCGDSVVDTGEACDDGPANSDAVPDACRSDCSLPACGDGVVDVEAGETCDPGPDVAGDHCSSDCQVMYCGNGIVEGEEACDDGNLEAGDGCSPDCLSLETCGNGIIDAAIGETCDDGNTQDGDGCNASCRLEFCGNGVLDAGEECDDGNAVAGDGCSPDCLSLETCGNRYVDIALGEQCDDGNHEAGDGCGPTCLVETCGNGYLDPGEECDDGNLFSGDGCSGDCLSDESCGNGYADYGAGEQCDDGNHIDGDGCQADCMAPICGDGILDPGEYCDDGNVSDQDGCSSRCVPESGWSCTLDSPAVCTFTCGDGVVALGPAGEGCDDGNTVAGDGCSPSCAVEPGWTCAQSPSACGAAQCGDGIGAGVEDCDGADLRDKTCFDLHFGGGTLACQGDCTFDVTGCSVVCGNGIVEPGEACDDGNTDPGDGCDEHCRVEDYYACWNEPSDCTCVTYVKTAASGAGTGASWADATASLQEGIDVAVTRSMTLGACEVWVAEGTYHVFQTSPYDTIQMAYDIPLYGGFSGSETARDQRDWVSRPTVLDGHDSTATSRVYHVITAAMVTILDGFTVTGGSAYGSWIENHNFGGGVKAPAGTEAITLRNSIFEDNEADNEGGTVYVTLGNLLEVEDCVFINPFSEYGGGVGGGAIRFAGAVLNVTRSTFVGNTAKYGGAIFTGSAAVTITDSVFLDNRTSSPTNAGQGGALFVYTSPSVRISNSLFAGNTAEESGGAMYLYSVGTGSSLTNSTIANNTAGAAGGAIYSNGAGSNRQYFYVNSIFWGNTGWPGPVFWQDSQVANTASYSLVQGGMAGTGNRDADPLFVDPASGDYRLQAGSPCIDAGSGCTAATCDPAIPLTDILGNDRYQDPAVTDAYDCGTVSEPDCYTYVDMGAYEYVP